MSLELTDPQAVAQSLTDFITQTFAAQYKQRAVIAVSGGIDSAVSLMLLARALGPDQITPLFLPYGDQSVTDAILAVKAAQIPDAQLMAFDVQPMVEAAATTLAIPATETLRLGNLKARARMLCIYDTAKKLDALVCGTENKSEHYLGYFTRFGDAASDLEPISTLYKTQIQQLATHLKIPEPILAKAPSAGLWDGQTDEQEMEFSYQQADRVLEALIDQHQSLESLRFAEIPQTIVTKIGRQVQAMDFKLHVPYILK